MEVPGEGMGWGVEMLCQGSKLAGNPSPTSSNGVDSIISTPYVVLSTVATLAATSEKASFLSLRSWSVPTLYSIQCR